MNKAFQNLPYKIGVSSMVFGHDPVENVLLIGNINYSPFLTKPFIKSGSTGSALISAT